jgi:hypothetical protein
MLGLPFFYRVLILAGVFTVLALLHARRDPSRWKEYAFVLLAACVAGVFGVLNDLITWSISPAYFEIAKEIPRGVGFAGRVIALGFQAGFVAGALTAGVLLYATNPRPGHSRVAYSVLWSALLLPAMLAMGFACVAGSASTLIQPYPVLRHLDVMVPLPEARAFFAVAAIHAGLYAGLIVGVVCAIRVGRRPRTVHVDQSLAMRLQAPTAPDPRRSAQRAVTPGQP